MTPASVIHPCRKHLQGPDMSVSFPNIKAIMWFDELKKEAQAGGAVIGLALHR